MGPPVPSVSDSGVLSSWVLESIYHNLLYFCLNVMILNGSLPGSDSYWRSLPCKAKMHHVKSSANIKLRDCVIEHGSLNSSSPHA